eukprot:NODE_108_length_18904_cov_0.654826.p13 type:complete len:172 gc:universal NODE_108_length_18904_cov_0.654826:2963-3478(+)
MVKQTDLEAGKHNIPCDLMTLPVFVRQGSIIPFWLRNRRSSELQRRDPITLKIYLKNDYAKGTLYMDDYESFGYINGEYIYREFEFNKNILSNKKKPAIIRKQALHEHAKGKNIKVERVNRVERLIIYGKQSATTKVKVNGNNLHFDILDGVLTVKDPKMLVKDDWEIHFE